MTEKTKLKIQKAGRGEWKLMDGDRLISTHAVREEARIARRYYERSRSSNFNLGDEVHPSEAKKA